MQDIPLPPYSPKSSNLRDQFAMMAMQALIKTHVSWSIDTIVSTSYSIADKMLKERTKYEFSS